MLAVAVRSSGPEDTDSNRSPFRVKGIAYRNARDYYNQKVRGGATAVQERLDGAELRGFLDLPFTGDAWYDVLPMVPITEAAARVKGVAHAKLVRESVAWGAIRDLQGPFKAVLERASLDQMVRQLPNICKMYFDFGSADGRVVRPGLYQADLSGIPEPLVKWLVYAVEGFVPVALTLAGATDVRLRGIAPAKPDSQVRGVQTVHLRFEVAWR
jgi:hypothetical protein